MQDAFKFQNLIRVTALLAIGLSGYGMVMTGFADSHAKHDPEKALSFDPHHPRALVTSVANALSSSKPFDQAWGLARIKDALSHDPYVPLGMSVLGLVLAKANDEAGAARAFELASDLSWHDPISRAFRLRDALLKKDMPVVFDEIDAAFRTVRDLSKTDRELLIAALREPEAVSAFAARLALDPPWRGRILQLLTESALPIDTLMTLRAKIEAAGRAYSQGEIRPLLSRMMREGRMLEAYVAWLKFLPEEKRPEGVGLYNGDFRFGASGLPFDWTFEPVAGSDIKLTPLSKGTVLSVRFLGPRVTFKNIYQTLVLPQGTYRFSGEEAAKGLSHEYGLRWRISCLDQSGRELLKTEGLKGDVFWQSFEGRFEVGADCPFQRLVLEAPIRVQLDRVILGSVSFRNLKITKEASVLP